MNLYSDFHIPGCNWPMSKTFIVSEWIDNEILYFDLFLTEKGLLYKSVEDQDEIILAPLTSLTNTFRFRAANQVVYEAHIKSGVLQKLVILN